MLRLEFYDAGRNLLSQIGQLNPIAGPPQPQGHGTPRLISFALFLDTTLLHVGHQRYALGGISLNVFSCDKLNHYERTKYIPGLTKVRRAILIVRYGSDS